MVNNEDKYDADLDLEARVRRLEEAVFNGNHLASSRRKEKIKIKRKRGPKPKRQVTIYGDRDLFVRLFESYWPEIEPMCGPTADIEGLKCIFTALKAQEIGQIAEAAQKLLDRLPFIKEFSPAPSYGTGLEMIREF